MTNRKMMWCIAAAIAAGGIFEPSAFAEQAQRRGVKPGACEELEVPVIFAPEAKITEEGYLRTINGYAVRIDQVTMNPCKLEMTRDEQAEQPDESVSVEGVEQALQLQGVSLKGRVFDLSEDGRRLPGEGVVIEGQLPVDVMMRRARRISHTQPWKSEEVVRVEYELPTEFFDEVDWSKLHDA